jgi:hypothetical protein
MLFIFLPPPLTRSVGHGPIFKFAPAGGRFMRELATSPEGRGHLRMGCWGYSLTTSGAAISDGETAAFMFYPAGAFVLPNQEVQRMSAAAVRGNKMFGSGAHR